MLSTKPIITHAQTVTDIASAINGPYYCSNSFGLSTGLAGKILFNCLYARFTKNNAYLEQAEENLLEALALINPQKYSSFLGSSFYQDLQEFGRTIEFIHQQGYIDVSPDAILQSADPLIYQWFCKKTEQKNLGVYNGAGAGFYYFLKRQSQSDYQHLVKSKLLDYLVKNRLNDDNGGLYWLNYEFPEPRLYTGSSHGNAMIINFLLKIREDAIFTTLCDELLHGAVTFLLNNAQNPQQLISSFPIFGGKQEKVPNLNLCYGDLGTGLAILNAAKVLEDTGLQQKAVEILLATTQRTSVDDTYIRDASILYGTTGTAVAYDKIFTATNIIDFKVCADYWYNKTLDFRSNENSTAGFQSYFYADYPITHFSFSFGITGIGLHLLGNQISVPVIESLIDLI